MNNLISQLSKPIPYQWRVQSRSKDKSKAICTAYIDARDVMKVLDEHCEWEVQYKELAGFLFAGIGIKLDGNVMWRWDCGQRIEDNPQDQMYEQAGKSAASDAFKRAAVMWGVGRFLYDLDTVTLPCDQYGNPVDDNGKRIWDLTKHINSLGKKSPEPPSKPQLDQNKYDSMVKFINDGKWKEVEQSLSKYTLTEAQKKVLTQLIASSKSEALKKSVK